MKINCCTNESIAPRGNVLIVKPERKPKAEDIAICIDRFEDIIYGRLAGRVYEKLGVVILFDRDWDALRLPVNRVIIDKDNPGKSPVLFGTFVVVGMKLDDNDTVTLTGLTKEQLHYFKSYFGPTVRVAMVNGEPQILFNLLAR